MVERTRLFKIFSIVITIALILGAFSEKGKADMVDKMVKEPVEKINTPVNNPSDTIPRSDYMKK